MGQTRLTKPGYIVGYLQHYGEGDPSFPTQGEAEAEALRQEALNEGPFGVWHDDGNDVETVAIVYEGSVWRSDD